MLKLELWQTKQKRFLKKFSNQLPGVSELSQLPPLHQPIKRSYDVKWFQMKPCNGSLKQEDRAEMPQERWKLRPSQWRIRVMVSVLKIGGLFKITCRKVSKPVRSSPIVLITCLPYIQSPTEIPKPPNKRIDGGVLPTCDTWPSVQINQIAINGPIALETSLPPCVNAPKHAVKIFYTRSFLLNHYEIPSSQLQVNCKPAISQLQASYNQATSQL